MLAMTEYFTEDPLPVLFVLAFVELFLIAAVKLIGQGGWLKAAVAVPIAAVLLLAGEWLIVTDREAVQGHFSDLRQAIYIWEALARRSAARHR